MSIQLFSSRIVSRELNKPESSALEKTEVNCPLRQHMSPPTRVTDVECFDFPSLGLEDWLVKTLKSLSISKPSDIQKACIPKILKGMDVVASAKTGSGKTAAFALPVLQRLSLDPCGIYCLILTPTRELAFQIAEQLKAFGQNMRTSVEVVVGGTDMMKQARELAKRPHFVVATPGRLFDLIESCADCLNFRNLGFVVFDEADRLLETTFQDHLSSIFKYLQGHWKKRPQLLFFSATLTRDLALIMQGELLEATNNDNASRIVMHEGFRPQQPFVYHSSEDFQTVSKLVQKYLFVPSQIREVYLVYLLQHEFESVKSLIIFAGKCKTAEMLRLLLRELGIKCTALHSKMSQKERIASLAKFKCNVVPILVTTDVGSRGLDIPTVELVINFDVPADARDYIHRIGRTARAGRGGLALTIMGEIDIDLILAIEDKIQRKLENFDVDVENVANMGKKLKEKDVLSLLKQVSTAKRVASMKLSESRFIGKEQLYKAKIQNSKSHI